MKQLIISFWIGLILIGCAVESKDQPVEIYHQKNFLFNSNFDHWQRGHQFTVGNGEEVYGADRWYVKNTMGPASAHFGQTEAKTPGSRYGASVSILNITDPAAKTGLELYQTLDNATTLSLVGEELTFSIRARALGKTTKVGVQFLYHRTEKMVDSPLDLEKIYEIRSDRTTLLEISAPSLKYIIPSEGVLGVRVRLLEPPAVGDGFVVEQAMLNPGVTAAPYTARYPSFEDEERGCQRFYQKSFSRDVKPPFQFPLEGLIRLIVDKPIILTVPFQPKRTVPHHIYIYDFKDGKEGTIADGGPSTLLRESITDHSFTVEQSLAHHIEWTVDAEIISKDIVAPKREEDPRTLQVPGGFPRLKVIE